MYGARHFLFPPVSLRRHTPRTPIFTPVRPRNTPHTLHSYTLTLSEHTAHSHPYAFKPSGRAAYFSPLYPYASGTHRTLPPLCHYALGTRRTLPPLRTYARAYSHTLYILSLLYSWLPNRSSPVWAPQRAQVTRLSPVAPKSRSAPIDRFLLSAPPSRTGQLKQDRKSVV